MEIIKNTEFGGERPLFESHDLHLDNVIIRAGESALKECSNNIYVDGLESDSKYVFQYVKNVKVHHAKITTKDAFWEVENVTIYNSELNGEYLGWHSKNLRLENCTFGPDCDRAFEYSTLQADIRRAITNIKNPMSGRIIAGEFGSVTIDDNIKAPADCEIRLRNERTCFSN